MLHSSLLSDTVQLAIDDRLLILNSAADPFVPLAAQRIVTGELILAEDNVASLQLAYSALKREQTSSGRRNNPDPYRHIPFHEYTLREAPATIDVAVMNMLYQPSNAWMIYGIQLAAYALKPGGSLYIEGAKDRGVLSMTKRLQSLFGNVETLKISKGQRVIRSRKPQIGTLPADQNVVAPLAGARPTTFVEGNVVAPLAGARPAGARLAGARFVDARLADARSTVFAEGKLDEGTRLLLEALEVHTTDVALDIGCGAGFIGLHIARLAPKGHVTMVDASLVTVDVARRRVQESGLANVQVLPSDGAQAVLEQRFDLIVTNPPFHLGGIQTTEIAERFIRQAAQVLRPRGRFYLVANRFLKYEPTLRASFKTVAEIGGNTRYKILLATDSHPRTPNALRPL